MYGGDRKTHKHVTMLTAEHIVVMNYELQNCHIEMCMNSCYPVYIFFYVFGGVP